MNFDFVWKLLLAVIVFVIINTTLQPLLVPLFAPFGSVAVVALYLGALGWLIGLLPQK